MTHISWKRAPWLLLVLAPLLGGCPADVSQLDTMKDNAAKGNRAANAAMPVTCTKEDQACYQINLIKGDACLAMAREAADRVRRDHDRCAAGALAAGIAMAPGEDTPGGKLRGFGVKRLEALRDLIDTQRGSDPSGAADLVTAAGEFRKRYPGDPAGPFYLASGMTTAAQDRFKLDRDKPALCTALRPINDLAREGGRAPGEFAINYQNLTATLTGLRRVGGCS
jgi:hypothetical protein